jgi:hypothetical protein
MRRILTLFSLSSSLLIALPFIACAAPSAARKTLDANFVAASERRNIPAMESA